MKSNQVKREEAKARQKVHDARTISEKLELIKKRRGKSEREKSILEERRPIEVVQEGSK